MHTTTETHITKPWLPLSILVLCFATLYHHVFIKMVQDWMTNDDYSHGFFIPLITCYLIRQQKENLSKILIKPSNIGIIILSSGLSVFLIASIGAELFLMRFSMLIVIWGLVVFLGGIDLGKATLLPVAYLIFMIPLPAIIWNKIAFPLKLFTTRMAVNAITFLDIAVYREGNIIHLSNTTLQVVDACSGMRSLTSSLAISAAFALIIQHSKTGKCFLFLSAIPIAILMNIIRLLITAILAQKYGAQTAHGFLHDFSGILVFVFAIILIYIVHLFLLWCSTLRSSQYF